MIRVLAMTHSQPTPSTPYGRCAALAWHAAWLIAIAIFLAPVRAAGSTAPAPRYGPAPAWVTPAPPANPSGQTDGARGQRLLLTDRQVRVDARSVESYLRIDREISDESGLQSSSQVVIELDPTYESVEIHSVLVRRNGETLDRFDPSAIRIAQREPNLEWQVFDGRLSVVLLVPDLRVHDVLSVAYTVRGADPTLKGKYGETFALGARWPMDRLRVRLLFPVAAPLSVHVEMPDESLPTLAPTVRDLGEFREYVWDRTLLTAAVDVERTPSWYIPVPVVAVSEFASWHDVSRWGAELFHLEGAAPALRQWLEETRRASPTVEELIVAVIRFVQDEVRYVAVEVGVARRRPNDPAVVFSRRYGDCKDKAALLTTLLRAAGVQAHPTLVSTSLGHTLDRWPPHPGLFDHVIVRVTWRGDDYWVDATETLQGGGLDRLRFSEFERALPLEEAGAELIPIAPEPQSQVIQDEFRVSQPEVDTPTLLDSTREYRGPKADCMRRFLQSATIEQVSTYFMALYRADFPSIRIEKPLEHTDDRTENRVYVAAHFGILNFWHWSDELGQYEGDWYARRVDEFVPTAGEGRAAPLAIPFPFHLHEVVKVTVPFDLSWHKEQSTSDSPAFAFDSSQGRFRSTWWNTYDLRTKTAVLGLADFEKHRSATSSGSQPVSGHLWLWPKGFNGWGLAGLLVWAALLIWTAWRAYRVDMGPAGALLDEALARRKVRGWLVVLLVFLVLASLGELGGTVKLSRFVLSRRLWLSWVANGEGRIGAWGIVRALHSLFAETVLSAYFCLLIALFLKRRRSLRWQLAVALSAVIGESVVDLFLYELPGVPLWQHAGIGARITVACLWIAYAWRSKRLRETFVVDGQPLLIAGNREDGLANAAIAS